MRQDTDVARMAAALRAPAMRYRSFGNEPVRNVTPRGADGPEAFSLLTEALAGVGDLSPDTRLIEEEAAAASRSPAPRPPPSHPTPPDRTETPLLPTARETLPTPVVPAAPDYRAPTGEVRSAATVVPQQGDAVPAPRERAPFMSPTPPQAQAPIPTLLQTLLAEAAPRAPQGVPPLVVGRYPPQDPPVRYPVLPAEASSPPPAAAAPVREEPEAVRVPAPSSAATAPPPNDAPDASATGLPRRSPAPVLPSAPAVFPVRGFVAAPLAPMARPVEEARPRSLPHAASPGSGSSLLDTLVGRGAGADGGAHYPLLDALSVAMRVDEGGASRLWPAARVEMALPELLRRVAAGVRAGRGVN